MEIQTASPSFQFSDSPAAVSVQTRRIRRIYRSGKDSRGLAPKVPAPFSQEQLSSVSFLTRVMSETGELMEVRMANLQISNLTVKTAEQKEKKRAATLRANFLTCAASSPFSSF